MSEAVAPLREAMDLIIEAGGESSTLCFQCGMCDSVCPWNRVKDFGVRKLIREAQLGLTEIEGEDLWQCATCGMCPSRCPRGVKIVDVLISLRKIAAEYDIQPQGMRLAAASLASDGNPWSGRREERGDWAKDLAAKPFSEGMEILYFPCCTECYDSRSKKSAAATVDLLQKAGVDFGVIGPEVVCCGESIRKAGEEEAFKRLARENIKTFIEKGVKRILVSSPHCYETFKNEYSEFRVHFDVVHTSQYLFELIRDGRIKFKRDYRGRVAYHDPCYLGRHNGIYDEPRDILKSVPGLELVEMADSRENSLCCGGGGARIWAETPKGERLSDLRLKQAQDVGASVLATFCPYCVLNFEDSGLGQAPGDAIEIKSVTEILQAVT